MANPKYPSLPLTLFKDNAIIDQFVGVLDWTVEKIVGGTPPGG